MKARQPLDERTVTTPKKASASQLRRRGQTLADAEEPSGEVRSVRRALQLLTLFDAVRTRATLSDLARESGLATSTVQRLLQTLEREHFVVREPDGHYALGTMIVRLGLSAIQAMPLHERAGPWLDALAEETGETANLAVLDAPGMAVYLRQKVSVQTLRHESWLGRPFDSRRTAAGRALSGRVDDEGGFTTRRTQTPGVSAAAAPVVGADGAIVAALNVTAPTSRTDDKTLEHMRVATVNAARELSRALGGEWPYAHPDDAQTPAELE